MGRQQHGQTGLQATLHRERPLDGPIDHMNKLRPMSEKFKVTETEEAEQEAGTEFPEPDPNSGRCSCVVVPVSGSAASSSGGACWKAQVG